MPVRAPVTEPEGKSSDGTEGKTSDAKSASLDLRMKELGHASVRVGSAAMPAPFAMALRRFMASRGSLSRRNDVKEPIGRESPRCQLLVANRASTPSIL